MVQGMYVINAEEESSEVINSQVVEKIVRHGVDVAKNDYKRQTFLRHLHACHVIN